jgi:hypothetical protein
LNEGRFEVRTKSAEDRSGQGSMLPSQVGARCRLLPLGVSVKAGSATPLVSPVTAIARIGAQRRLLPLGVSVKAGSATPLVSGTVIARVLIFCFCPAHSLRVVRQLLAAENSGKYGFLCPA